MPNIKSIINAHNKKILSPNRPLDERTCNCIRKETCPMNRNCHQISSMRQLCHQTSLDTMKESTSGFVNQLSKNDSVGTKHLLTLNDTAIKQRYRQRSGESKIAVEFQTSFGVFSENREHSHQNQDVVLYAKQKSSKS